LITSQSQKAPAVVLYKKFDEGTSVFDGSFTEKELTLFVETKSVPLMDEIGPENYEKYTQAGLPIAYFFYGTKEQKTELGPMFETIAKKYQSKILFVYLDASLYGGHGENLALKQEWPAFAIQVIDKQEKYPFDQKKKITSEAIEEFVESFHKGELEPTMKSDPIPETNNEPVVVVVGKSFETIALDKTKDVLVEFYAPWCGHCKKLAPIYESLAKKITHDNIVIAKMDSTTNDAPGVEIQGFPTIMLFKAKTNEKISFNGDRTVEGFVSFLKQSAEYGSELNVDLESKEDEDDGKEDGEL
jgi:protein disulfide-isomerase A1